MKIKYYYEKEEALDAKMNQFRTAVEEALNNEQMVLQDSPLAMAIDQEIRKQKAAVIGKGVAGVTAGVAGTAAGAAGVAGVAHFGAAIPLILSTSLAAGMFPVTLAAAAGVAAVGTVAGVVGGKKAKEAKTEKRILQLEKQEIFDRKKRKCIRELKGFRRELAERQELERYAVQERHNLLGDLSIGIENLINVLNQDLQTSKTEKDKLEGELKKKNGKSK